MTIRLTQMLNESMENRLNLTKIDVIMEKMLPELKKNNLDKITEKCSSVRQTVEILNNTPYTIHGVEKWKFLRMAMMSALMEIKNDLLEIKDVDVTTLVKALDELFLS